MKSIRKILATILAVVLIVAVFPVSSFALGTSVETAQEIKLGETVEISAFENGGEKWLSFTPETDGCYIFYSFNNDFDILAYVHDSSGEEIGYDDDSAGELNFKIVVELSANETYYINSMPLSEDNQGKYSVSVKTAEKAQSISLNKSKEITLYTGVMYSLEVEFLPEDAAYEEFTAMTDDEDMISLWASVEGVNFCVNHKGEASITVTSANGLSDTIYVTALDPEEILLNETKEFNINAKELSHCYSFIPTEDGEYKISVSDANDDCHSFTDIWDENDVQITCVSGYSYYFTADLKAGKEYRINSKNNNGVYDYTAEMSLTIEKAVYPTAITLIAPDYDIYSNEFFNIEYKVEPENANVTNVGWYVDDDSVLEYCSENEFRALKAGTTTITATTDNGVSAELEIEVLPYETLSLNETKSIVLTENVNTKYHSFTPEQSGEYRFGFVPNTDFDCHYTILDYEWNSLDYSYDCVCEIFAFLEAGKTYNILVENNEYTDVTVELTVNKAVPPESFDILLPERIEGYVGKYITMETSLAPEGCSKLITWTSSDENVAYCYQNGDIDIRGTGTATITGTTSNGLIDSIEVVGLKLPSIEVDKEYISEITENGDVYYEFIPEESGYYAFDFKSVDSVYTSISSEYEGYLGGYSDSFKFYFEGGVTYKITICMNYVTDGSFSFVVSECIGVKSVEILTLPERLEYVKGFEHFTYYGLTAKVTLEDGTTAIYDYDSAETVFGYGVTFTDCRDEFDTYSHTRVFVGDVFDEFSFIIKENTVESIEYVGEKLELIENDNGYYSENYFGEEFFYYHYYDLIDKILVKINFTDRESIIAGIGEYIDGYYMDYYADQYNKPWTLGDENYIEIGYLGADLKIPVSIVETPVRKIVVNKAPPKVYYQHDYYSGSLQDDFYPYLRSVEGLSFTVYFKDGTSKTYTNEDIDDYGYIDGYRLEINQPDEIKLGNVEMTAKYMGAEFSYNVVYKEFPYKVKDIKVVKLPAKTEYINGRFPDFTGTVVEITYEDGSTKLVEFTKDNMTYEERFGEGYIVLLVDIDGFALQIGGGVYYGGNTEFDIAYGGVTYTCDDLTCLPKKEVESVEVSGGNDIIITVNYLDGTTEVIDPDNDVTGVNREGKYVMTSGGICYFYIFEDEGLTSNTIVYTVCIFGQEITHEVSKSLGDVNGDGNVNVSDMAQLKKLLAGLLSESEAADLNSDIDGNSITNVSDLAQLKKIIAGLI